MEEFVTKVKRKEYTIPEIAKMVNISHATINTYLCRSEFRQFEALGSHTDPTVRNSRTFKMSKKFLQALYDILATRKRTKDKLGIIHYLMQQL